MYKLPTFIFDLDGVITDTGNQHFESWKKVCKSLNYNLTDKKNRELKGVSRIKSLKKIGNWADLKFTKQKFNELLILKNKIYLEKISQINNSDIIEGVYDFITNAKKHNHLIALYSSSKNANFILEKLKIKTLFDAIVDGNNVKKSKPNPEGFLLAAELTNTNPLDCVVFEDSQAGITAANLVNMKTIGIGKLNELKEANRVYENFNQINLHDLTNVN
jgi:beta-phosphoglucomutase